MKTTDNVNNLKDHHFGAEHGKLVSKSARLAKRL